MEHRAIHRARTAVPLSRRTLTLLLFTPLLGIYTANGSLMRLLYARTSHPPTTIPSLLLYLKVSVIYVADDPEGGVGKRFTLTLTLLHHPPLPLI